MEQAIGQAMAFVCCGVVLLAFVVVPFLVLGGWAWLLVQAGLWFKNERELKRSAVVEKPVRRKRRDSVDGVEFKEWKDG